jgi:hypothetical protein
MDSLINRESCTRYGQNEGRQLGAHFNVFAALDYLGNVGNQKAKPRDVSHAHSSIHDFNSCTQHPL